MDNIAGHRLFAPSSEGGEYQWINPFASTTNTKSRDAGLDAEDLAEYGSYLYRKNDYTYLDKASEYSTSSKTVEQVINDPVQSKVDVQFRLYASEYVGSTSLPEEVYMERSADTGVFYDLLPLGYRFDPTKGVVVQGAASSPTYSIVKQAALVSVEVQDDYMGTGRQLVTFRVMSLEAPGKNSVSANGNVYTGFRVVFWASISWGDLTLNPGEYNTLAYQRGDNAVIANGYADVGAPSSSTSPLYYPTLEDGTSVLFDVNGDGETTKKDTLYSYATIRPEKYTSTEQGIKKMVMGKSGIFQAHDIVDLDNNYRYKITLTTGDNGTTRDVVLYDILEGSLPAGTVGWKGTYAGTNTSLAKAMGIDVKVYYSTATNLNYNDTDKLALDSGYWTLTPPADLSEVTAVAFDLTTGQDGEPYVFDGQKTVQVEITMRSPNELQELEMAHNRPAYTSTFKTYGSVSPQTGTAVGNTVTIELHDLQDFEFIKQYETVNDETGEVELLPLSGIEFRLYQCTNTDEGHTHTGTPGAASSCWGTTAVRTAYSDATGKVSFTDLDNGVYAIREYTTRTGYVLLTGRYWVIEVDAVEGKVSAPEAYTTSATSYPLVPMVWNEEENGGYYSLVNQRAKKYIQVTKAWTEDGARIIHPPEITLELYRNGQLYQTKVVPTPNSSNATVRFEDLFVYDEYGEYYNYEVREVVPEGYTASPNPWTIANSTGNTSNTIRNTRLGVLDIKKLVVGGVPEKQFTFNVDLKDSAGSPLYPLDEEGNPVPYKVRRIAADGSYVDEQAATDETGRMTLTAKYGETLRIIGLPVGATYTVTEEEVERYTGQVTAGSASGTTSSTVTNSVTFTNTYAPPLIDIPVEKVWEDGDNEDATRPANIMLQLQRRIEGGTLENVGSAVTVTATGEWKYTFTQVPQTDMSGNDYIYSVLETSVPKNYEAGYDVDDQGVLLVTNTLRRISINGTKTWSELGTGYVRPGSIIVTLLRDGVPMGEDYTQTVTGESDAETWSYEFTDLLEYNPVTGEKYVYTVTEEGLEGSNYNGENHGMDLTNLYPAKLFFTVTKEWDHGDLEEAKWPETVTIALYRDGELFTGELSSGGVKTLDGISETPAWTHTFEVYQEDADGHVFTIVETPIPGYTSVMGPLVASEDDTTHASGTLTNTYTPTPVTHNVSVRKAITGPLPSGAAARDFAFTLTAKDSAPMPGAASGATMDVAVTGTGEVSFGDITFTKAGTYVYTIQEVDKSADPAYKGYTFDTTPYTLSVVVSDPVGDGKLMAEATITADGEDDEISLPLTITNVYEPLPVNGEIDVEKSISGSKRPENGEKTFTFTLEGDDDGTPMPTANTVTITDEGSAAFGPIVFTKTGTFKYTVKESGGEEPGYTYDDTVYEAEAVVEDLNGQLTVRWTMDGTDGNLTRFTNTYAPAEAKVAIPVRKTLTGSAVPEAKTFTFKLTGEDSAPMPASDTLVITGAGTDAFDEITFKHAGTYIYTVKEVAGSDPGYTYDAAEHTVTVTVIDTDGVLSATWTVDDGGSAPTVDDDDATPTEDEDDSTPTEEDPTPVAIEFTNSYAPAETALALPVTKTIQYVTPPTDKDFTFTLTPVDDAPMPASDTLTITGASSGTFGEITYDAAGTYIYTVKEIDGSDRGYTYDALERTVVVTVVDNNGALSATWTVDGETADAVIFTNNYQPLPTELTLPVTKTVTGQEPPEDADFTFDIDRVTEGAPLPEETTLVITGEGEGTFEAIPYTSAGTYVYTVTERTGSQTGYTYDTAVNTVTVTVTDEDGQLEATWTAERDGVPSDGITFANHYEPAPVNVSIPVKKEITGHATPSDKDFTFTLTGEDGAPMPEEDTLTIIGANSGTFGEITFTAAGVYTYTVQEIDGSEPGYTYDTATREVVVTVTDIGGVLSATWTVDGEEEAEAEFTNSYAPAPTSVSIPVRKTITGDPTPSDKDFTFTLTGEDGAPMPEEDTLTITGANGASFGEITFDTAGTYTYTLQEVSGEEPGYGYDLAQHTITVTVTDENGALSATWVSDGEQVEEVEFTNTYAPGQATLSLPIRKTVEGSPAPTDKTFRFELVAQDSAPMPADAVNGVSVAAITGSGTSAFGVITYAHAGTYRYTIHEITGTDKGYTYDDAVYDVEVTVTDTNGVLSVAWTMDGENADAVAFTNSYAPLQEQLRLPVRKAVDGEPPEDARFTFQLSAENGAPMPEGSGDTVEISGEGTGQFGAITYTEAGTYLYTVHEIAGSDKGYTYDETEYQVTVTVTDNDGELEAAWSAKKDGAGAQELMFTNVYAPDPVELALGATKTLKNGRLTEGMFSFTLSDEFGRILETVTNAEDGSVAFSPITYTKAGKYTYVIAEVQGSLDGITYDKTTYTVNVTVTDEGGVLTAAADHVPEEVNFVNKYLSTIPKGEIPKTGYGEDRTLYTYTLGLSAMMMLGWLLLGRRKRTR